MKKFLILSTFFLFACAKVEEPAESVEGQEDTEEVHEEFVEIENPFMLKADSAYLKGENEAAAEVYIIDLPNSTVYIDGLGKDLTEEELEAMEDMTSEELDEFIDSREDREFLFELTSFEQKNDSLVIEYEDQRKEFKILSDSIFEDEAGIRYQLEENTSQADYEKSLLGE
ncbi:MAG: hypothetical protein L0L39_04525 [Atopostipes suicloacalis]|nr:hypothetical protein [Atopostipes suicloacalis]MDN6731428.1 hypothetical protein [Atopostipes suicloacalis]